jgi:hypothetical protein
MAFKLKVNISILECIYFSSMKKEDKKTQYKLGLKGG